MKALLFKHHDVTGFCSKDPSEILQRAHLLPGKGILEATNGRALIRVPVATDDSQSGELKPTLIPAEILKGELKALSKESAVSLESKAAEFTTTGTLEHNGRVVRYTHPCTESGETHFPKCDRVIPAEETREFSITLSAKQLAAIVTYANKHGKGEDKGILFRFGKDNTDPVTFKIQLESGSPATGVLMPMRTS